MSVQTNLKIVDEWYKLHIEKKLSHVEIAKLYNVNRNTVYRNFKRFNLKSFNYNNQIKHDPEKFTSIKTEEDAYWLGFIYADGCVSDEYEFEIGLKESDYLHLEKFRQFLNLTLTVKFKKSNNSCRIVYGNKIFTNNLKNLGVLPRKSLTLKFPYDKVPKELIRHFIRGYFDGDGCISIYKKGKYRTETVCSSLLGTKDFLDGIRLHSPIQFGKYIKNNGSENTLVLSASHKKARTFINWLYEDSTIFLDRKYEKYKIAVLERNL